MKFSLSGLLLGANLFAPALSALAGNEKYDVENRDGEWSVYTPGYESGRVAVTRIITSGSTMMIRTAYNGADKTNPKLHLNEVLQAVWTEKAGLSLQSLSRVKFLEVANSDVKAACRYYRKKTKLEDADEFEFDVDRVSSKVYKKFSESPFGLVVGRLCSAAGKIPNAIAVDVRNGYDDVAWELI